MDLNEAIYKKNYDSLGKLIASGADLNITDKCGSTPLITAVLDEDADPMMAKFLVDSGADINKGNQDEGLTPLHLAARDGKVGIVRILLDMGASVNSLDNFGDTPLWRAVFSFEGKMDIVETLLSQGADPDKKNNYGVSPLDLAKSMGCEDLVQKLGK